MGDGVETLTVGGYFICVRRDCRWRCIQSDEETAATAVREGEERGLCQHLPGNRTREIRRARIMVGVEYWTAYAFDKV